MSEETFMGGSDFQTLSMNTIKEHYQEPCNLRMAGGGIPLALISVFTNIITSLVYAEAQGACGK